LKNSFLHIVWQQFVGEVGTITYSWCQVSSGRYILNIIMSCWFFMQFFQKPERGTFLRLTVCQLVLRVKITKC